MNRKQAPQKMPASGDWPSHYLLYRLREARTSYARISRLNGYCPTAAIMVNHQPWPKMEAIVAKALGVTPRDIWPSRYNEDGTPIPGAHTKLQRRLRARNKNMAQPRSADNVEVSNAA